MSKELISQYLVKRYSFDDRKYLLSTVAYHAAPTIYNYKPASLINFTAGRRNLHQLWQRYKYIFANGKLQYYELRNNANGTLVLFYCPDEMKKVIFKHQNMEFLKQFGYSTDMTLEQCLERLSEHFQSGCPHEVGIFLGYPVEDVNSFIQCGGKNCLLVGCWKVYHNPDNALKTFECYEQAKCKVLHLINSGMEPYILLKDNLAG